MSNKGKREILFSGLTSHDRIDALRGNLEISDLLPELGIQNISIHGSEAWANCPYHDDKKRHWSININEHGERWGLHSCFVCRESGRGSGNIVTLVKDQLNLESYSAALTWIEDYCGIDGSEGGVMERALRRRLSNAAVRMGPGTGEEDPAALWAQWRPLRAGFAGWDYLTGRGVSPEQISARGIRRGEGAYEGRVVIPIYRENRIVNFYARSIGTKKPKGLYAKKKGSISTSVWGLEHANLLLDLCYIFEGCFDGLTAERLLQKVRSKFCRNIVAVNGPIIHEQQARLLRVFKKLVIVPDMKGKAQSLVPTAKKYLREHELLIVQSPRGVDFDDWGREDPESASQALTNPASLYSSLVEVRTVYTIRT
jgi:hypothetical protein